MIIVLKYENKPNEQKKTYSITMKYSIGGKKEVRYQTNKIITLNQKLRYTENEIQLIVRFKSVEFRSALNNNCSV